MLQKLVVRERLCMIKTRNKEMKTLMATCANVTIKSM